MPFDGMGDARTSPYPTSHTRLSKADSAVSVLGAYVHVGCMWQDLTPPHTHTPPLSAFTSTSAVPLLMPPRAG